MAFSIQKTQFVFLIPLALNACNFSQTPYIDTCQSVSQQLMGTQGTEWEEPRKSTVNNGELRIDLTAKGTGDTVACLYRVQLENNETGREDNLHQSSPYSVEINGQAVSQSTLINATIAAGKEYSKQSIEEIGENVSKAKEKVIETTENATEVARKTAIEAAKKVQKTLE